MQYYTAVENLFAAQVGARTQNRLILLTAVVG